MGSPIRSRIRADKILQIEKSSSVEMLNDSGICVKGVIN